MTISVNGMSMRYPGQSNSPVEPHTAQKFERVFYNIWGIYRN